ncbi:MAG: ABC transporter permease [Candidatus Rokubacteria bacterium]|nr:ABC transporter permease [Candidatus Rokubacteria bacterium]
MSAGRPRTSSTLRSSSTSTGTLAASSRTGTITESAGRASRSTAGAGRLRSTDCSIPSASRIRRTTAGGNHQCGGDPGGLRRLQHAVGLRSPAPAAPGRSRRIDVQFLEWRATTRRATVHAVYLSGSPTSPPATGRTILFAGPTAEFHRHEQELVTARAKGVAEAKVVGKHALKNALIPVVTVVGLQYGFLLGGAVVTETIFAWPGVGRLAITSILQRDYPVVQGCVLLVAVVFVLINLVVDLLYGWLDPRIRYE